MRMRDPKVKRFEIRMTEEEFQLLQLSAEFIRRTPTEFVRLLLDRAFQEMRDIIDKGEQEDENKSPVFNDQL